MQRIYCWLKWHDKQKHDSPLAKRAQVVLKERPTPLPTQPATQIVPSSCFVVL